MQHYCALQRRDGQWDFTCSGHPAGYCHAYRDPQPTYVGGPLDEEWVAKCEANKHKFHTSGHATAEEACECYMEYELDFRLHEWDSSSQQHKCKECGCWTTHIVQLGGYAILNLCPEHATRDIIKKHHGPIGQIWES